MIPPDINVLEHAFRADSPDHRICLRALLNGSHSTAITLVSPNLAGESRVKVRAGDDWTKYEDINLSSNWGSFPGGVFRVATVYEGENLDFVSCCVDRAKYY